MGITAFTAFDWGFAKKKQGFFVSGGGGEQSRLKFYRFSL